MGVAHGLQWWLLDKQRLRLSLCERLSGLQAAIIGGCNKVPHSLVAGALSVLSWACTAGLCGGNSQER
jgi:hypothetical protein